MSRSQARPDLTHTPAEGAIGRTAARTTAGGCRVTGEAFSEKAIRLEIAEDEG